MCNFTWNRFPIKKNLLIDSLLTPTMESTYFNRDMCKFESSQKDESRWQSTDSSKAYRNTSAFKFSMHVDRSEDNESFLMHMLLQCHNQLSTSEVNRHMLNIYASDNYIEGFFCYRIPKVALTTLLLVAKDFIHKRFCFIHKAVVCSTRKLTCWLVRRYLFYLKPLFSHEKQSTFTAIKPPALEVDFVT